MFPRSFRHLSCLPLSRSSSAFHRSITSAFSPSPAHIHRCFSSSPPVPPPSSPPRPPSGSSSSAPHSNSPGSSSGPRSGSGSDSGSDPDSRAARNARLGKIFFGMAILTLGLSYAAVPIYRAFCQKTGFGGTVKRVSEEEYQAEVASKKLGKDLGRPIRVSFSADVSPDLHWRFVPSQYQLNVRVGEPALAFFVATNQLDKPITGVATYNVTPMKVGNYFRKIQCFCFDEQRLEGGESVDMPVFFYVDPEIEKDRNCDDVTDITLGYTFFRMNQDDEEEERELEKLREQHRKQMEMQQNKQSK